ncbi:hypothetical protein OOK31_35065 [Streptomyces sp. NBC_00249]|uniref:D-alanyl-D-alanine carboxypeptidase n=1 Tax=Streptomyces sp. NBC_00249 TaxID=2975690 RepID=UPI0022570278|nr:hypothetical protein [Streptomyces sp. NBC_00249]MCX5199049.1 hypothetical protein [Streptomyces sp. NBC_00249]
MAGESPDKSVDEGASGAAESSGEQDPRFSVFQPLRRRDPLKEAVAAWVATAEPADEAEAGSASGSASAAETQAIKAVTAPEPSPGRVEPPPVVRQGPPPADPRSAPAKPASRATRPDDDSPSTDNTERTAVFRALKPPTPDSASPPAAAEPASGGSERTAVFRAVKPETPPASAGKPGSDPASADNPDSASPPDESASGTPRAAAEPTSGREGTDKPSSASSPTPADKPASTSSRADESASGDPRAAAKPASGREGDAKPASGGSERTAVFRAVKPETPPASGTPRAAAEPTSGREGTDKPASASAPTPADKPGTGPAADKPASASSPEAADKPASGPEGGGKPAPADSERTAVFRSVKPGAAPASADKPGSGPAAADKPASGDPRAAGKPAPGREGDGKPASGDSERTAVFRAVKPGSAPAADKPGSAPADKPASGDPRAAAKPADKDASGDSERTAVFRAVKPGAAPASADKPGSGPAKADKPAAGPQGDRPAPGPQGNKPADGDSESTAVFRAVKPGAAPAKAGASTFVPLRGEEKPAPPKAAAAPAPAAPAPPRFDSSERTTQQPLPPRPPLDMLADLTNNPPPPPSPLRTTVRRFKIYAPVVLLLAVVLAVVQLVRPLPAPQLVMTAKSSYAFPGGKPELPWPTEGQASMAAAGLGTIGSSGEQKPVPIASVTKSMTAYIIMRDHPFKKGEKGKMIDIDKTAETEGQKDKSDNESTLNTVKEGDKLSEYDAIAALMIPSANNIARLLARWDAGSQEEFVKKMNATAKELGMTNTTYTDPSGLDATTVSTAEDQVKLGLKIVEIPALVDITRMPSWTDPYGKAWPNWNRLVPMYDSLGIKTGTTTKAGGNLLFAAQKKVGDTNQLIVGAVLGQHKPPIIDSVIAASKSLLIATQKAIEGATVVKKGAVVGYVDDGLGGRTPVVATADVQAVGWSSLTVDLKLGDGGTPIPSEAKAGTPVGVLTVGEGASQVKVPVALKGELTTPGIGSKLTRIG